MCAFDLESFSLSLSLSLHLHLFCPLTDLQRTPYLSFTILYLNITRQNESHFQVLLFSEGFHKYLPLLISLCFQPQQNTLFITEIIIHIAVGHS